MEKEQERYLVKHCMHDVDHEITFCTYKKEMNRKQLRKHIGWLPFLVYKKSLHAGETIKIKEENFMGRHPCFTLIKLIKDNDKEI